MLSWNSSIRITILKEKYLLNTKLETITKLTTDATLLDEKIYIKEAVRRVQEKEKGKLQQYSVISSPGDQPEMDTLEFLNNYRYLYFQMLVGMLNWILRIGRFGIAHATTSLVRFAYCPRKGHLERALRVFGYLNKYPNKRVVFDSWYPIIIGGYFSANSKPMEDFK